MFVSDISVFISIITTISIKENPFYAITLVGLLITDVHPG